MDERLLREIQKSNPWWSGKKEHVPEFKRKVFTEIMRYERIKQIVALIGLRRVGKTVLMKQVINEILGKVEISNVLFFSFEEQWGKQEVLEDLIYHYLENTAKAGRKYIFLDEIQKVAGWEDILKRFYDRHEDIKFMISGSASINISKSVESLAGRIFDVNVTPLTFEEFLELNGIYINAPPTSDYSVIEKFYIANIHQKEKITFMFSEYLFRGGFPEIALETDEEIIRKYIINSVIDRILLKDLPQEFEIKKPSALREILEYASRETSGIFVIDKLSSLLSMNRETTSTYVEYLKRAFLIHILYNYTGSAAKQIRTSKKIHIVLPGVAIAMESYGREMLLYPEVMGKYVESLAAVFMGYRHKKVFFWRTPQKDEVDIILKDKELLPIEVKYANKIYDKDLKPIMKFCKLHRTDRCVVVTKDLLRMENKASLEMLFIPAWVFLLVF